MAGDFFTNGWCRFAFDSKIAAWADHVRPQAGAAVGAPENTEWLRYGGTWFAGVNVLGNDETGRVGPDGPALAGAPVAFIAETLGLTAARDYLWDRGQVSVCYPGYPKTMTGETEGARRYRLKRDAAHLDGLMAEGERRRRYLREHHAFILGIPLTDAGTGASPLVVWEGSHTMIRAAFSTRFDGLAPGTWNDVDVTEVYQTVRRDIFERCRRIAVHARPGESYLLHRHTLHGVAPWGDGATAEPDGRMIVYFRPAFSAKNPSGPEAWLTAP